MERPLVKTPQLLKILKVLRKYSEGVWLRKIAREAELSPDTVSRYVYYYLRPYLQIRELTHLPQRKVVLIKLVKEPKLVERFDFES